MDRLRTLIVDDEPGMRTGAKRVLQNYRLRLPDLDADVAFDIELAADGAEARRRLDTGTYDLVLLDYKLPDASGLDILHEIKAKNLDLMAIMITAFSSLEVAVSATKNGAFDFLSKPFAPEELESVVAKAARNLLLERRARRLSEEKRRLRLEFISVLVHELKAPLGAVEGYLKLMKDRVLGENVASYDAAVNRSLVRTEGMRKLIYDMLDLARIEAGERKRALQPLDLAELARHVMETQQAEALQKRLTMTLHAPERLEWVADRGEMEIVFNNLLSNAVKYNRDGGEVEVTLAREGDTAVLRVRDTGIGLAPGETGRLFGEFVRIRNEKTMLIPGSGLGLSTARKLAQRYGGDITVESREDVGSVFELRLRQSQPEAAAKDDGGKRNTENGEPT